MIFIVVNLLSHPRVFVIAGAAVSVIAIAAAYSRPTGLGAVASSLIMVGVYA